MTKSTEDRGLEVLEGAEVSPPPNLPDGEETEGEAVVLLGGGEGGHELLDHHYGLSGRVTHQASHTLGDIGSSSLKKYVDELIVIMVSIDYLVNAAPFATEHGMGQESKEVRVTQAGRPSSDNGLEEVQHG